MRSEPGLAAGLKAYNVHPNHVYHLWWQRWHYAAAGVAAGYNMLMLDADISLRADPYPLLRTLSPPRAGDYPAAASHSPMPRGHTVHATTQHTAQQGAPHRALHRGAGRGSRLGGGRHRAFYNAVNVGSSARPAAAAQWVMEEVGSARGYLRNAPIRRTAAGGVEQMVLWEQDLFLDALERGLQLEPLPPLAAPWLRLRRGGAARRVRTRRSGRRRGWPTCACRSVAAGWPCAVLPLHLLPPPASPPTPTPTPRRAAAAAASVRAPAGSAVAGQAKPRGSSDASPGCSGPSRSTSCTHGARARATGRSRPRLCSSATRWARAPSTAAARSAGGRTPRTPLRRARRCPRAAPPAAQLPRQRRGGGREAVEGASRRRSRGAAGPKAARRAAATAAAAAAAAPGYGGGGRAAGWQGQAAEGAWRRRGRGGGGRGGGGAWSGAAPGRAGLRSDPGRRLGARVLVLRRHRLPGGRCSRAGRGRQGRRASRWRATCCWRSRSVGAPCPSCRARCRVACPPCRHSCGRRSSPSPTSLVRRRAPSRAPRCPPPPRSAGLRARRRGGQRGASHARRTRARRAVRLLPVGAPAACVDLVGRRAAACAASCF